MFLAAKSDFIKIEFWSEDFFYIFRVCLRVVTLEIIN